MQRHRTPDADMPESRRQSACRVWTTMIQRPSSVKHTVANAM
jgi:hypothetical protein